MRCANASDRSAHALSHRRQLDANFHNASFQAALLGRWARSMSTDKQQQMGIHMPNEQVYALAAGRLNTLDAPSSQVLLGIGLCTPPPAHL